MTGSMSAGPGADAALEAVMAVGGHCRYWRSVPIWSYFINDPLDGSTYKRLSYYTNSPVMIAEYYNK